MIKIGKLCVIYLSNYFNAKYTQQIAYKFNWAYTKK